MIEAKPAPSKRSTRLLRTLWASAAVKAGLIFVLTLGVYWLMVAAAHINRPPFFGYFNDLADSFLHGRLYLPRPRAVADLTLYNGYWYVPFPPLPALLLLPWVAWQGLQNTNTQYFSLVIGALNVALVYLFLNALSQRGWTLLRPLSNIGLTLLFGFGSVHWYLSIMGEVWFVSQICTVMFVIVACWIAVANGSAVATGLALALAMYGRPTIILTYPLLLGFAVQRLRDDGRLDRRRLALWIAGSVLPLIVGGIGLLAYNYARFDDVTDFGYIHENVDRTLVDALRTYGQFNIHYIGDNLNALLVSLPDITLSPFGITPNLNGLCILLTMPILIYLVRALRPTPIAIGGWVAFVALLVPLLLYYNTGWAQFGYRFSLDFLIPLLTLLAIAAGRRLSWPMVGLIVWGIVVNGLGANWFLVTQFH